MAGNPWVREEVEAIVADYRHMLIQELNGQSYNKSAHNQRLQQLISRSHGSIERKHQNISGVLRDADCYYIRGYKPLGNYQALLAEVVEAQLLADNHFDAAVLQVVAREWLPPIDFDPNHFVVDAPLATVSGAAETPENYGFRPVKRDYLAREARNKSLGNAGEELVVNFERFRLEQEGQPHLARQVEQVSSTRGDGLGYDVLSFETSGEERFIEVKTTGFGMHLPFYMSRREVEFSRYENKRFNLYRVFDMQRQPHMFMLQGDMRKKLQLDPVSYRARVSTTLP